MKKVIISKDKLLDLMNQSKVSIQDLAIGINTNYSTVNRIVNGETLTPRPETIHSIANFFGVSPSFICENLADDNCYDKKGATTFENAKDLLTFLMNKTGIKSTTLLHRASGIQKSTLDKLLSGDTATPNLQTVQKLSEYFNLSVEQIRGLKPITVHTLQEINLSKRLLPILSLTDIGEWIFGNYNNVKVTNYIHSTLFVGKLSFAIKIPDESYEPDFMANSTLVIDTQAEINNGSYVVIKNATSNEVGIYEVTLQQGHDMKLRKVGSNQNITHNASHEIIGVAVQEVRNLK